MRDEMLQEDLDSGEKHSNDVYVKKCAVSDLMHFEIQGKQVPETYSCDVLQAGSLELLRTLEGRSEDLLSDRLRREQERQEEIERRARLDQLVNYAKQLNEKKEEDKYDTSNMVADIDAKLRAMDEAFKQMGVILMQKLAGAGNYVEENDFEEEKKGESSDDKKAVLEKKKEASPK